MTIATIFSGIGAPEQGAKRVYGDNLELVFACEYDKFARKSFKAIYNIEDMRFHNDITEFDATSYIEKVDCLVGGSPCQAFSIAGLRKGTDDHRGGLIYEYVRIVDEVKAPVIIYENVKGILSIDKGETIKQFIQAIEDLGYHCKYKVLNTKDYGVPQNRERFFLVGFLNKEHHDRFEFAPKVELTKRIRDVLEESVDEKYYLNKARFALDIDGIGRTIRAGGKSSDSKKHCFDLIKVGTYDIKGNDSIKRVYSADGACPCLTTMGGGHREPKILDLTVSYNEDKTREYEDYSPTLRAGRSGLAVTEPMIFDHQGRLKKWDNPEFTDFCPTLRAQSHGNEPCVIEPKIIQLNNPTHSQQRVYSIDGISPTISAGSNGGGKEPCKHLTDDYRIRKLTPLECWRLQDFPDTALQKAKEAGLSNTQLYK